MSLPATKILPRTIEAQCPTTASPSTEWIEQMPALDVGIVIIGIFVRLPGHSCLHFSEWEQFSPSLGFGQYMYSIALISSGEMAE